MSPRQRSWTSLSIALLLLAVAVGADPLPTAEPDAGLVHWVIEFGEPARTVQGGAAGERFDLVELVLTGARYKPMAGPPVELGVPQGSVQLFEQPRLFSPLLRDLELPAGEYRWLEVVVAHPSGNGAGPHSIRIDGDDHPLDFAKGRLRFSRPFTVTAGRITTLHAEPVSHVARRAGGRYRSSLELEAVDSVHHPPVDGVWLDLETVTAVGDGGAAETLRDQPLRFELLGLRSEAVVLVANRAVPAGTYGRLSFELGADNAVEVGGEELPLEIVAPGNTELAVAGPALLRGGRVSELILAFEPDRSIFHTRRAGFVLDVGPSIALLRSLTGEQEGRLTEALGGLADPVAGGAELIVEGRVGPVEGMIDLHRSGRPMIYSQVRFEVDDLLRGAPPDGGELTLRLLGGEVGGLVLRVEHMPSFRTGEACLLFLAEKDGRLSPVRGHLGKIDL